ncbi:MAG: NAD-dependent epimerase/dehydratase family protein [Burkholderiaceae bacterium]
MARTLITGIAGFTGRHLASELTGAGHEVVGLTHAGGSTQPGTIACDLTDAAALNAAVQQLQPEAVVHLAGISLAPHGDVDALYRTNVLGTRNLLAALVALPQRPKAVLLASNANVYGNASVGVVDESVPPAPASDYAVSKLAMEYMAQLWRAQLPITIVRPFNYTGVGQSEDFLLPKIVGHFQRRAAVLELGNLDVERDFSDVRSVARCYRLLLKVQQLTTESGAIFNVCSGTGYTLREVLSLAAELTGYMPEVRVNPAFVRANEVKRLVGSKEALEQAIGPVTAVPLRETIQWMLQSGDAHLAADA